MDTSTSKPIAVDLNVPVVLNIEELLQFLLNSILDPLKMTLGEADLKVVTDQVDDPLEGLHIDNVVLENFNVLPHLVVLLLLQKPLMNVFLNDFISSFFDFIVQRSQSGKVFLKNVFRLKIFIHSCLNLKLLMACCKVVPHVNNLFIDNVVRFVEIFVVLLEHLYEICVEVVCSCQSEALVEETYQSLNQLSLSHVSHLIHIFPSLFPLLFGHGPCHLLLSVLGLVGFLELFVDEAHEVAEVHVVNGLSVRQLQKVLIQFLTPNEFLSSSLVYLSIVFKSFSEELHFEVRPVLDSEGGLQPLVEIICVQNLIALPQLFPCQIGRFLRIRVETLNHAPDSLLYTLLDIDTDVLLEPHHFVPGYLLDTHFGH